MYLYSHFGAKGVTDWPGGDKQIWEAEDGFEEWDVQEDPARVYEDPPAGVIPEPLTMLCVLVSMSGVGAYVRKRMAG